MFGTTRIYAGMSNVIYELNKTHIYVWMKYSIKTDTSSTSSFYRYYDTISMNDIATMRYRKYLYKCDPSDSSDPYWIYHSSALGVRDNGAYIRISAYTIKTPYNVKGSFIEDVYSTDTSAYPSDSISINYWYTANGYDSTYSQGIKVGTVNDKTETTYPNNARHTDIFWYVKLI